MCPQMESAACLVANGPAALLDAALPVGGGLLRLRASRGTSRKKSAGSFPSKPEFHVATDSVGPACAKPEGCAGQFFGVPPEAKVNRAHNARPVAAGTLARCTSFRDSRGRAPPCLRRCCC